MTHRTVYALADGEYSDYRIQALFNDKATAEAAVKAQQEEDESWNYGSRVEEFTLYDEVPEKVTVYSLKENIWDDGSTSEYRENIKTALPWNHLYAVPKHGRPKVDWIRAPIHKNKGGRLEVRGTDLDGVRKAFSDRKAQLKARA